MCSYIFALDQIVRRCYCSCCCRCRFFLLDSSTRRDSNNSSFLLSSPNFECTNEAFIETLSIALGIKCVLSDVHFQTCGLHTKNTHYIKYHFRFWMKKNTHKLCDWQEIFPMYLSNMLIWWPCCLICAQLFFLSWVCGNIKITALVKSFGIFLPDAA